MLERPLPEVALKRLLAGRLPSGAYRTAEGFAGQAGRRSPKSLPDDRPDDRPDYRDVTPVVGWNDKVFRLLALLLEAEPGGPVAAPPEPAVTDVLLPVSVWGRRACFRESATELSFRAEHGELLYRWSKDAPWAHTLAPGLEVR